MGDAEEEQHLQAVLDAIRNDDVSLFEFSLLQSEEGRRRLAALVAGEVGASKLRMTLPDDNHPLSEETKEWLRSYICGCQVLRVMLVETPFIREPVNDDGTLAMIFAAAAENGNVVWFEVAPEKYSPFPDQVTFPPFCRLVRRGLSPQSHDQQIARAMEHQNNRRVAIELVGNCYGTLTNILASTTVKDSLEKLQLRMTGDHKAQLRVLASNLPYMTALTRLDVSFWGPDSYQGDGREELDILENGLTKNYSLRHMRLRERSNKIVRERDVAGSDPLLRFVTARNKFIATEIPEGVEMEQYIFNKVVDYHQTARIDLYSFSMINVMLRKHVELVCSFQPTDGKYWLIDSKTSGFYEQHLRSLNDPAALAEYNLAMQKRDGN